MQVFNWHGYRVAAWLGVAILALIAGLALIQGKPWNAGSVAMFAVFLGVYLWVQRRLPPLFLLLVVIAVGVNAGGWAFNYYDRLPGYDEIGHFLGGLAATLVFGLPLYHSIMPSLEQRPPLLLASFTNLGLAFGVAWEFGEFALFRLLPNKELKGLPDTISDLLLDGIGAVLAALLVLWLLKVDVRRT